MLSREMEEGAGKRRCERDWEVKEGKRHTHTL